MKLNRSSKSAANQGSVLLVAVGTVVVLGIILAGILALITQERRVLARTSSWNTALPAAEAGVEEAMSHLRQVQDGPRGVNGWQASGSGSGSLFTMSRYLAPDSRFTVAIDNATPPTIISMGETICTNASNGSNLKWIQRRVKITTTNMGTFHQGMVARRTIKIGGNFAVDSFDSSNQALSNNGQYDPTKRNDKGGVASNSSQPGAITISGGVDVYGSLSTGPTGTVVIATGGSVGSKTWVDSGKTGIEADHYAKDMNLSFDDVSVPFTNGITPPSGVVNGVAYQYVLQDGMDYKLSTLNVKGSDYMYVSGKARLLVDTDIKATAGGVIHIATNASLEVYVAKGTVSITGTSILNDSGKAASFSLFGLNELSNISIKGDFIGTINAPRTALDFSGGGDIMGAIIVDQIKATGNYKFHYDEALAKKNPMYFFITSWEEI